MYETVIGLEVHLALSTDSKMFCSCPAESQKNEANTATCPVCLGLPGSLPTINENAVEKGIMFSLALDCQVPELTGLYSRLGSRLPAGCHLPVTGNEMNPR